MEELIYYTNKQLKAICKTLKLKSYHSYNKTQLINIIISNSNPIILSGICFFSFLKINEKRILLLGEEHSTNGRCENTYNSINISDYIYNLCKNNPNECFDLYVETPYDISNIYDGGYGDSELGKIQTNKKEFKKLHNIRYHYIDIRQIVNTDGEELFNPVIEYVLQPYIEGNNNIIIKNKKIQENNYLKALKFSIGENYSYKSNYVKYIKNYNIDNKSNIDDKINKYFDFFYSIINKIFNKIPKFDKEYFYQIFHLSSNSINDSKLANLVLSNIDIYFLLRLLEQYNFNKMNRESSPKVCRDLKYQTSKNIIVFTGASHSKFYSIFLKNYFDNSINLIEIDKSYLNTEDFQCIKLNKEFNYFS